MMRERWVEKIRGRGENSRTNFSLISFFCRSLISRSSSRLPSNSLTDAPHVFRSPVFSLTPCSWLPFASSLVVTRFTAFTTEKSLSQSEKTFPKLKKRAGKLSQSSLTLTATQHSNLQIDARAAAGVVYLFDCWTRSHPWVGCASDCKSQNRNPALFPFIFPTFDWVTAWRHSAGNQFHENYIRWCQSLEHIQLPIDHPHTVRVTECSLFILFHPKPNFISFEDEMLFMRSSRGAGTGRDRAEHSVQPHPPTIRHVINGMCKACKWWSWEKKDLIFPHPQTLRYT